MDEDQPTAWASRKVDEAENVYERHGRIFRIMWVAVAVVVLGAGIAMTVVPGPVTVVVPAGLIMLAAVFGWARTLLLRSVQHGVDAKHRFDRASTSVKALTVAASACVGAAALALVVL